MIRAIYTERLSDDDLDFVAAFETERMPEGVDWVGEVKEYLEHSGETVLIIDSEPKSIPDVLGENVRGQANPI